MLGVSDEANLELGPGNMWKSDGAREPLVFLGVVVLKTNLELNGFNELSLLSIFVLGDEGDAFRDLGLGQLCAHGYFLLRKYI